ncbi:MAG: EAL domain-containing protein [Desulfobulbus sp.]|nr:EAL domain-containing protein [Desulfobulbus sp.]
MNISRYFANNRLSDRFTIGQKIFIGNLLILIIPLILIFTILLNFTFNRINQTIESRMEAAGSSIVDMIKISVDTSIYNYLRAVAEKNLEVTNWYYQKQLRGELTKNQAQETILNDYSSQRIGDSGYIYVLNSQGVPIFHPQKLLVGMPILQRDSYHDVWPFIRKQIEKKTGYIEYSWKNPDELSMKPKALYMTYFKPWDWIISVCCYREEFSNIIDFNTIEERLGSFRYGKSGYALILNEQGKILTHPFLNDAQKPLYSEPILKLIEDAEAGKQHIVRYKWKNPTDTNLQEKLMVFKRIPQLGLIIGVTAYTEEIYSGSLSIRSVVLSLGTIAALLAIGTAFLFSRLFTRPLRQFALELKMPEQANDYRIGCEIHFLISKFHCYFNYIQQTNNKLQTEIQFRKSAENFLQIYKQIFDSATEGIVITDATGKILAVNDSFTEITGYESHEAVGQNPRILKSEQHDDNFFRQMWQNLTGKGSWEGEIWNKKKDGTIYPEWMNINCIRDGKGTIIYYFAMFYEIGELKKREKQIAFMAYHDILTRLPNRAFLEHKLTKNLAETRLHGGHIALFLIDLDNFKNVNDVFGHHLGDDLLLQVSQRFAPLLSGNDTLCRIGGDEFIFLMENIESESAIYLMANRIQAVIKKPFLLEFKKIYVSTSIGISTYPGDGESAMEMIRSADMAMHKAKREGKNKYVLFTKSMHDELYEKFRTENGIRYGLLNKEFVVFYQPKVNIENRRTSSLEALIRWKRGGKMISPGQFIPIAEETSLIDDLCMFVLETTCGFLLKMKQQGVLVPVSVNISPRQFHNADFVDMIEDLLMRYTVESKYLEFEITETTAMKDVEHTLKIMHRLREMGFLFSIDDFGTGYSSLGYLNKMPVNTLKIDKQFVDDLQANGGIVATIIAISQQMHLNVVAEGVETEEQLLQLGSMGCNEAQGYYFSRPVSEKETLRYLLAENEV